MNIELYRHYIGAVGREKLGMRAVSAEPAAQARELFAERVRRIVFTESVPIGEDGSRAALDLLRELAAWGVHCEWRAAGRPPAWQAFSHLPPPTGADDAEVDLDTWRSSFFPGKCTFREGPGFIQVRDRRSGSLECYTVDEPEFVAAIRDLATGTDPHVCDRTATRVFVEHGLLVRAGELRWWAPARLRRWPVPAMVV